MHTHTHTHTHTCTITTLMSKAATVPISSHVLMARALTEIVAVIASRTAVMVEMNEVARKVSLEG